MQIINAGYQVIDEPTITKKIERIARVCYKSEERIAEGTDIKMLTTLLEKEHLAMLEHGDICMEVSGDLYDFIDAVCYTFENNIGEPDDISMTPKNLYLRRTVTLLENDTERFIISGNIRAWYQFFVCAATVGALPSCMYDIVNDNFGHLLDGTIIGGMDIGVDEAEWETDLSNAFCRQVVDYTELSATERMVHETISVLFTVDRGVTHEIVRHRDCSFAQESTRYCNYSLGKYNREITVIEPCFFARPDGVDLPEEEWAEKYGAWRYACEEAEKMYFRLIDANAIPQQARDVLPTSVKAEIVVTANLREWKHIFNLRACDATGPAHPQMAEVMRPLLRELRQGTYAFAFGNLIMPDDI